jgi:hypothetical protein
MAIEIEANIASIPVISVSYNAPKLIETLITSLRQFYSNKIYIIDGSEPGPYETIKEFCARVENVELIHFDYNIHHGPGMAWAFQNLALSGRVLVIDSDVIIVNNGFLESLDEHLKAEMYGVGYLGIVNEEGFDLDLENDKGIPYLKPACMLCNIEVVRQWPMPVKHGAPMTPTMIAIHNANRGDLLGRVEWLHKDFHAIPPRQYLIHDWQGTVKTINSYELNDWIDKARERKTIVDMIANLVPETAQKIVEIGESDGLLARVIKERAKKLAKEIDYYTVQNKYANPLHQKIWSDGNKIVSFDGIKPSDFQDFGNTDCWILDSALEYMRLPELILNGIKPFCTESATLIIKIKNRQNWREILNVCASGRTLDIPDKNDGGDGLLLHKISETIESCGYDITQALLITRGGIPSEPVVNHLFEMSGWDIARRAEYERIIAAESFLITLKIRR